MKNIYYTVFAALLFTLSSCFAIDSPESTAAPISHSIWDGLLKKHVDAKGFVDYGGFAKDEAQLDKYLALVSKSAPASSWSTNEKLAYWINAYNAFTVKLILDNADQNISSIKDIGSKIKIPFVNTPWDVKFIKIGGKEMDLNNIEHGIVRKQFKEPRIHFALVCAAKSCPPLRNEAFVASKLSAQLDDQGVRFINDSFKNEVSASKMNVSKLFDWYGGDFKKTDDIENWINKYAKTKAKKGTEVTYKEYYWGLNGKL
ncbi:DUF547 domain-containing protein [Arcticibacterium luteifluviistationis]|uniref:DUF547 domain-containing protein n=1 Tax=Arcticibacterium luteifluviistationis TaxID=1784714 RepID=A0A2Z4GH48_9BACT|nr:DUF547 domain-containing protein [Arcticibacterium luteifluviistationis]AWW00733.1 DUF547 domain-containing protein [Arcticibacterium luteifluviistationis]